MIVSAFSKDVSMEIRPKPATFVAGTGKCTYRITGPAKYVFLDIVGFTRGRFAEAQDDIVRELKWIVLGCMKGVPRDIPIYLPTGDGLCIVMQCITTLFDLHLKTALRILEAIADYNDTVSDPQRQFAVRVGVNQNTDLFYFDINGRKNVAGAGINIASRLMDEAGPSQILVGRADFDELSQRERYSNSFRYHPFVDKHGTEIDAYQYIGTHRGLNTDPPPKNN